MPPIGDELWTHNRANRFNGLFDRGAGVLDLIVPQEQNLPDCDIVEVNAQLNDGLKTCRSVVSNYKALLTAELQNAEVSPGPKSDEARARRQDTGEPNSDT